jgi:hypothetical protein
MFGASGAYSFLMVPQLVEQLFCDLNLASVTNEFVKIKVGPFAVDRMLLCRSAFALSSKHSSSFKQQLR